MNHFKYCFCYRPVVWNIGSFETSSLIFFKLVNSIRDMLGFSTISFLYLFYGCFSQSEKGGNQVTDIAFFMASSSYFASNDSNKVNNEEMASDMATVPGTFYCDSSLGQWEGITMVFRDSL